ncbi:MAG: N-acetylmuramoyl-L-alanine amidase, partial [Actinomyces sp.]
MGASPLDALFTHRRADWDPSPIVTPVERSWADLRLVELHHLGDGVAHNPMAFVDTLRGVKRYHVVNKGWRDVFYNVFVEPATGIVVEGRRWETPSQRNLTDALTVAVIGDTRFDAVTPAAERAIARLAAPFGGAIRGHRERASTTCPGDAGMVVVDKVRRGQLQLTTQETAVADLSQHPEFLAAQASGLTNGDRPNEPATRAEAAIMAERARTKAAIKAAEALGVAQGATEALTALGQRVAAVEVEVSAPPPIDMDARAAAVAARLEVRV